MITEFWRRPCFHHQIMPNMCTDTVASGPNHRHEVACEEKGEIFNGGKHGKAERGSGGETLFYKDRPFFNHGVRSLTVVEPWRRRTTTKTTTRHPTTIFLPFLSLFSFFPSSYFNSTALCRSPVPTLWSRPMGRRSPFRNSAPRWKIQSLDRPLSNQSSKYVSSFYHLHGIIEGSWISVMFQSKALKKQRTAAPATWCESNPNCGSG